MEYNDEEWEFKEIFILAHSSSGTDNWTEYYHSGDQNQRTNGQFIIEL